MKKRFIDSKAFGALLLLFGVFGFLILGHHIFSYEAILRPQIDDLIARKVITNNINGPTFLYFFTNQSNIFVFTYFILFALGLFGSKKLYRFTHNDRLRCGVTLYILITGIIYCIVLLPFSQGGYPWEGNIWFSNIFNYYVHMLSPLVTVLLWLVPFDKREIPIKKGFGTVLDLSDSLLCFLCNQR